MSTIVRNIDGIHGKVADHSTAVRKPLIVQSDRTLFLDVNHPDFIQAQSAIAPFTELLKSPEYVHTYQMHRLTLWHAVGLGLSERDVMERLLLFSQTGVPLALGNWIKEEIRRAQLLRLERMDDDHLLLKGDRDLLRDLADSQAIRRYIPIIHIPGEGIVVTHEHRGKIKQLIAKLGYYVRDQAGYVEGASLATELRSQSLSGATWTLRPYQRDAIHAFFAGGVEGGSGVVVLPCGSGKTVVGLAAIAKLKTHTLIVTPSNTAAHQWEREIKDKLDIDAEQVSCYTTNSKMICPITITTYQMLAYHKADIPVHFHRLSEHPWGFIIYDEVHLLPAPMFRLTAQMQATRRLGLTATLIREDGLETDVCALIGPKKYDVPWRDIEAAGHIAKIQCVEIAVDMSEADRIAYASANARQRQRLAATNTRKLSIVEQLIARHTADPMLIIGEYIDQLQQLGRRCAIPVLTGATSTAKRERLYESFRSGRIRALIVSKVANVAVDLPDATIGIQISGAFGSRQEEAQRLGRLLRPKSDGRGAIFYTIVSRHSVEQERARHRQLFLVEQGYDYQLTVADEKLESGELRNAFSGLS